MTKKDTGFSIAELLIVVIILGIVTAFAIPQALNALKAYKLHSDAAAVAAQLNVTRFRATSQFAPYRLNINTSAGTFSMERLCGNTPSSTDSNCTGPYQPRTTPQTESGTLYLAKGDSFTTTNPGGSTFPGTITAAGATTTTFYFNTRGMPVDGSGNPVASGGNVIYLRNPDGLTDAVVVSVGGRISVYNWSSSSSAWVAR